MDRPYKQTPFIVARKVAGELLFVPIKEKAGDLSVMYTANETGVRIWELLIQNHRPSEIAKILQEEYGADEEKLKQDVQSYLEDLLSIKALTEA